ncbi:hypothetical protein K474DRAFT_1712282 [Panus rudis PR-1116 ss-1]|nr:hypothetical protein K474DRAFT_1712282 [Panus rudis PR-1116 ss-1]
MFSARLSAFLTVVASVGLASAQVLTTQCQTTLASIAVSPEAACLNPQGLVAIVTADSNASLVGPIDNWLKGQCSQPMCTNETLQNIVTNITAGCHTEFDQELPGVDGGQILSIVKMVYPTVRKVACLSDNSSSNNTLCVTELLNNLQPALGGTISKSEISSLVSEVNQGQLPNIQSSAICTDCTKEAFNVVKADFPDVVSSAQSAISSECGANFVDGSTPSGIQQTANTATASPVSAISAATLTGTPVGVFVSALIALLSPIALLA